MKTLAYHLTLLMICLIAAIAWADTPLIYNGITLQSSRGMSIVFPDVCKTPLSGGPVSLPYPNLAIVSDFDQGTRKVKGGGNIEVIKKTVRTTKGNQEVYELKLFDSQGRVIALRESRLIELKDGTYCAVCMAKGRVTSLLKLQRMSQNGEGVKRPRSAFGK
jgi:hypothetical protein